MCNEQKIKASILESFSDVVLYGCATISISENVVKHIKHHDMRLTPDEIEKEIKYYPNIE